MNLFPLHKGLLWKEWRQNRWVFWLGLLVLSTPIIWFTLLQMLDSWISPIEAAYQDQRWRAIADVGQSVLLGHLAFFPFASVAVIALGGFLLAQERTVANTLDFLVATPVSRREIIAAKFATGLKMIGIVVAVNLVFVLLVDVICQTQTPVWWVIKFFCEQFVFLVAIFSEGLLLAVVCGNLFSTAVAAFAVNIGPIMVINFLGDISNRYFGTSVGHDEYHRTLNHVSEALTLFHYTTLRADQVSLLQVLSLVVVAVIFYWLTLVLFERNEMERNGRFLMFGDFWKLAQVIVPLFFALLFGFGNGYAMTPQAWIKFVIAFVILFLLIKLARRVMRSFGFR